MKHWQSCKSQAADYTSVQFGKTVANPTHSSMGNSTSIQLACLLMAATGEHRVQTEAHLRVSRRVEQVDCVEDETALRHQLAVNRYDLAVLLTDESEALLPACLLRYPDMRVLVITTARKTGPLDPWLQRGASDVVRFGKNAEIRHAIGRLLDECIHLRQRDALLTRVSEQSRLTEQLLDHHPYGVAVWQAGKRIHGNHRFQRYTGDDGTRDTVDAWLVTEPDRQARLLGEHSLPLGELLATLQADTAYTTRVRNRRNAQRFLLQVIPTRMDGTAAHLVQLRPLKTRPSRLPSLPTDSVTGLPDRNTGLDLLERLITLTPTTGALTAVLLTLPSGATDQQPLSGTERTLLDLAIYRASHRLQSVCKSGRYVLARTRDDQLLLVQPASGEHASQTLAHQVTLALGTLGGMLDNGHDVRAHSLTLNVRSLTARGFLARLERGQREPGLEGDAGGTPAGARPMISLT